jgi:Phosphorylase superfamily
MMRNVEILAPTFLEYWAVRCILPHARASWTGVRLVRWKGARQGSIVVVCGLAGALAPGLRPGTVLIPNWIGLADGKIVYCDPTLVQALVTAARTLHFQPDTGPLLTAQSLIVGSDRHDWSQRGFVAVDMETGLLAGQNLRVATIRVVLDSPEYGLSPDWLHPTKALLQPRLWRELFWLSRVAPRYALRAAHVLKVGLGTEPGSMAVE